MDAKRKGNGLFSWTIGQKAEIFEKLLEYKSRSSLTPKSSK